MIAPVVLSGLCRDRVCAENPSRFDTLATYGDAMSGCPECGVVPSRFVDGDHADGCSRRPRCPTCGMDPASFLHRCTEVVKQFAAHLVERYADTMDPAAAELVRGDLAAGEWESAAIVVIEDAPDVSAVDITRLKILAADFDDTDREIALRVVAKRRAANGKG